MRAPRAPGVGRIGDMASGAIPIRGRGGAPGLVYARRVASWMRGSLVFVGYGAAVTAAAALAGIRSRATPTASVAASPGMFAFGDLLWFLLLAGLFSLPPTWVLVRTLRGAERLWRPLARAGLPWAAMAPVAAALVVWSPGGGVVVLAFLRLLFTPISLVVFLATWRTSAEPDTRRRALRALALEAGGLVGLAAWLGRAVLSRA